MNRSHLAIAAILSLAAVAAQADDMDRSGQFAATTTAAPAARTQVQAQFVEYKATGVNPWSISYNPLNSFRSSKTRAQVTAEYLGSRDAVAAFTSEDSGSAYLAARKPLPNATQFAGQPVNAQ